MSTPDQTLACVVTRYSIVDGRVLESTTGERTRYWIGRGYLFLGNSEASGPVEQLYNGALSGQGWLAQRGARQVYVDGSWGGRSYPEVYVEAHELVRVLTGAGAIS